MVGGILVELKGEKRFTSGENGGNQREMCKSRYLEHRGDEEKNTHLSLPNAQGLCDFAALGIEVIGLDLQGLVDLDDFFSSEEKVARI